MTWLGRMFHQNCERHTSVGQAALGLAAGSVTGAAATTIFWGVAALATDTSTPAGFIIALWMFPFTLIVWSAGLFVLASPGWFVLHALGARCQQAAMLYGAGLTFVVAYWLADSLTGDGASWQERIVTPAVLGAIGLLVGWVVARVAYKAPPIAA